MVNNVEAAKHYEVQLREMSIFHPVGKRFRGEMITIFKFLKGFHVEVDMGLFPTVPKGRN